MSFSAIGSSNDRGVSRADSELPRALSALAHVTIFPSILTQEIINRSSWSGRVVCYPFNFVLSLYGTVSSGAVAAGTLVTAAGVKVTAVVLDAARCSGASAKVNGVAEELALGAGTFGIFSWRALKNSVVPGSLCSVTPKD